MSHLARVRSQKTRFNRVLVVKSPPTAKAAALGAMSFSLYLSLFEVPGVEATRIVVSGVCTCSFLQELGIIERAALLMCNPFLPLACIPLNATSKRHDPAARKAL